METFKSETVGSTKNCAQCAYMELEQMQGQLQRVMVCHQAPPGLFAMPAARGIQMITQFPIVQANMFCHQFVNKAFVAPPKEALRDLEVRCDNAGDVVKQERAANDDPLPSGP